MSIDAVGMGGVMNPSSASAVTPAMPDGPRQGQANAGDGGEASQDIQQMIDQIQSHINMMNVSLEFSTYGEHNDKIAVIVANKETGEVIREIPSKEIQDLYAKMNELTGMIFNAQI